MSTHYIPVIAVLTVESVGTRPLNLYNLDESNISHIDVRSMLGDSPDKEFADAIAAGAREAAFMATNLYRSILDYENEGGLCDHE